MASDPDPRPDNTDRPPVVRLARGQEVGLGCGTLILIALIVLIFSNRGDRGDNRPVLEKLQAIEQRLDAIERRLPEMKPDAEKK